MIQLFPKLQSPNMTPGTKSSHMCFENRFHIQTMIAHKGMGLRQGFYCREDTTTTATLIKEKHLIGDGKQFRGLVHYCHNRK